MALFAFTANPNHYARSQSTTDNPQVCTLTTCPPSLNSIEADMHNSPLLTFKPFTPQQLKNVERNKRHHNKHYVTAFDHSQLCEKTSRFLLHEATQPNGQQSLKKAIVTFASDQPPTETFDKMKLFKDHFNTMAGRLPNQLVLAVKQTSIHSLLIHLDQPIVLNGLSNGRGHMIFVMPLNRQNYFIYDVNQPHNAKPLSKFKARTVIFSAFKGARIIKAQGHKGFSKNIPESSQALETKLLIASQYGDIDEINHLLFQKNVNPNIVTENCAPIFIATQYHHYGAVKALIKAQADITTFCNNNSLIKTMFALKEPDYNSFSFLVETSVDRNIDLNGVTDKQTEETALELCFKKRLYNHARILIENGADITKSAMTIFRRQPNVPSEIKNYFENNY